MDVAAGGSTDPAHSTPVLDKEEEGRVAAPQVSGYLAGFQYRVSSALVLKAEPLALWQGTGLAALWLEAAAAVAGVAVAALWLDKQEALEETFEPVGMWEGVGP